jgi:hypothetical protein
LTRRSDIRNGIRLHRLRGCQLSLLNGDIAGSPTARAKS